MQIVLKSGWGAIAFCLILFFNWIAWMNNNGAEAGEGRSTFTHARESVIQPVISEQNDRPDSCLKSNPHEHLFADAGPLAKSNSSKKARPNETAAAVKQKVLSQMTKMRRPFIQNRGQIDKQAAYYVKTGNGAIYLTYGGTIVFAFARSLPVDSIAVPHKSAKERGRNNFPIS